jgi:hypothetical protein
MDAKSRASEAYKLAVRFRADAMGAIPYAVLARLTPEEWGQIGAGKGSRR